MKRVPPPGSTERARRARKNPTDAEKMLWNILRRGFPEFGFRREVNFRHYRADFASHVARLVIEADGSQHSEKVDAVRSAVIEADGYTILRFWNTDILGNPDGVAERIAEHLRRDHPHPPTASRRAPPSPIKGEG